jgi:hypothetical protein
MYVRRTTLKGRYMRTISCKKTGYKMQSNEFREVRRMLDWMYLHNKWLGSIKHETISLNPQYYN